MPDQPPELIAIEHNDYHAKHVGRTADGRQFFLTTPFEPVIGGSEGSGLLRAHRSQAVRRLRPRHS